MPACLGCHRKLDGAVGSKFTREEKEAAFTKALEEYWLWLWVNEMETK